MTSPDPRIPSWDLDTLTPRSCPFCREDGPEVFTRPDGLAVYQCPRCSCAYVSPVPSEDAIQTWYRSYWTTHKQAVLSRRSIELRAASDPRHSLILDELESIPATDRSLLDVGTGLGDFLLRARSRGYQASGCESDPAAVTFCRETLQFYMIRPETLAEEDPYPFITVLDVVEHLHDPLQVLTTLVQRLSPGGCLVVWTPNAAFQNPAYPVHLPFQVDLEHLQYLTAGTAQYLETALQDVELIHLETVGRPSLHNDTRGQPPSLWTHLKASFRHCPGLQTIRRCRRLLRAKPWSWRRGAYHLFFILRKTENS